jgi:hypothetical protein
MTRRRVGKIAFTDEDDCKRTVGDLAHAVRRSDSVGNGTSR